MLDGGANVVLVCSGGRLSSVAAEDGLVIDVGGAGCFLPADAVAADGSSRERTSDDLARRNDSAEVWRFGVQPDWYRFDTPPVLGANSTVYMSAFVHVPGDDVVGAVGQS